MTDDAGVLLYDPDCTLCTRFARLAERLSRGRLAVQGIGEALDQGRISMPVDQAWETMHHVAPDGTVRSGPDGVAPVVRTLPGGRVLVRLLRRVPGAAAANARVYWWLAGRRSESCLDDA